MGIHTRVVVGVFCAIGAAAFLASAAGGRNVVSYVGEASAPYSYVYGYVTPGRSTDLSVASPAPPRCSDGLRRGGLAGAPAKIRGNRFAGKVDKHYPDGSWLRHSIRGRIESGGQKITGTADYASRLQGARGFAVCKTGEIRFTAYPAEWHFTGKSSQGLPIDIGVDWEGPIGLSPQQIRDQHRTMIAAATDFHDVEVALSCPDGPQTAQLSFLLSRHPNEDGALSVDDGDAFRLTAQLPRFGTIGGGTATGTISKYDLNDSVYPGCTLVGGSVTFSLPAQSGFGDTYPA